MQIEDLGLEKEFIGLKEDVVIVDVQSPPRLGPEKSGSMYMHEKLTLSSEEAAKCKKNITRIAHKEVVTGATRTENQSIQGDSRWRNRKSNKLENCPQNYFVKLPPEEEDSDKAPSLQTLKVSSELSKGFQKRLDLKRCRDEPPCFFSSHLLLLGNGDMEEDRPNEAYSKEEVRGVLELADLCIRHKPSLLFLMETKARKNKVEFLRRKLRFDKVFVVEAIGRSGGLALFWKNSVVLQVMDSCANFIHTAIQLSSQGQVFLMTFMYGHPDFSDRRHLWPIISNLNHDREIEEFKNFLDSVSFTDMALQGGRFTWCNNRDAGCVREWIDRCLFNEAWLSLFPSAWLETVPVVEFDHSPLILSQKIAEVSAKLQVWEKNTFKRADKEIIRLRKTLSDLLNDDDFEGRMDQVRCVKRKLADLKKQEEKFWESRSRVKWLRSGDKNTRFFHAVTMQRRNINRISCLQLSNGEWEIDETKIMEAFSGFYSDLFTTINPPDPSPLLASFPVKVSEAMNTALLERVSLDELKSAVFGLGALKAPGPDGLNGMFFQKGAMDQSLYQGIKLAPTCPNISHLLFADDAMFFAYSKDSEIYSLVDILNKFTNFSGQKVNVDKSGIIFEKSTPQAIRNAMCSILNIREWISPSKYLAETSESTMELQPPCVSDLLPIL
ncbi:reverse transcriptase [Senna tora]|uniref:Reverse transcriptase n=1 Tax=Senna tora TaxID=362788 RepID=A0A834TQU1_9FABA|nr:reverse transcriptase [Senna tora]